MTVALDTLQRRRHLLFTMLTACAWRDAPAGAAPVVVGIRTFLGGWLGIGRIVVGMARQSYDLQLTRYGEEGWRATFYPAGRGHYVTSVVGSQDEEDAQASRGHREEVEADEVSDVIGEERSPSLGGRAARRVGSSRKTVRSATVMPSLRSSAWIRGAPQSWIRCGHQSAGQPTG